MKTSLLSACCLAACLLPASAAVYEIAYTIPSGAVPDGDTNGRVDVRNISGIQGRITDVDVFLSLEGTGLDGGWNGDLYATLRHESALSILLNRPGRSGSDPYGSSRNGLTLTFDDSASNGDVHLAPDGDSALLGTWAPDARDVSPLAAPGAFDTAPRTGSLGVFLGLPVAGDWTLLVMDVSSGGQVALTEWGLRISYDPIRTPPPIIPESDAWWIPGLGLLGVGFHCLRRSRRNSEI